MRGGYGSPKRDFRHGAHLSAQTARIRHRLHPLRGLLGGHLRRGDGFPPVGGPHDGGLAVGLDVGNLHGPPVLDDPVAQGTLERAPAEVPALAHPPPPTRLLTVRPNSPTTSAPA